MKRFQPFVLLSVLFLLLVGAVACSSSKEKVTTQPLSASGQRTAPLQPNDDFVNDSLALVGNTGKPQLIELFAFT